MMHKQSTKSPRKIKVKDYGHALKQPVAKEVDLELQTAEKPLELNDLAEPLRSHVEAVIQNEVEKTLAPHITQLKQQ